jgi:hypothetical protein
MMALEGSRMLRFRLTAFDSDGDGATLPLAAFDSAVFDGDDAERGRKKKNRGCGKKKGERKKKKKKEKCGKRKYNCLKRREGIIIVKFEIILFTMLTFLLK